MSQTLQVALVTVSILVFCLILIYIRKSKLTRQTATIWILWSFGLIIISIFPNIIYSVTNFLGIAAAINGIFLIVIFILYILVFYLYLRVSNLESKLKALAQHVGIDDSEKKSLTKDPHKED